MTKNTIDLSEIFSKKLIKVVASSPMKGRASANKIVISQIARKNEIYFQAESFVGKQAFHNNIGVGDVQEYFHANIEGKFKQVCFILPQENITLLTSEKGITTVVRNKTNAKPQALSSQNRQKNYILNEGMPIPALVDLGIFTKDFKVVNSMYDKFKQINRFVEILDDYLKNETDLTILDFGCGKSYLTFVVYYYLTEIRHINAKVIGYDLKADVVQHCNLLAKKYNYNNLHFVHADVSKDKLYDQKIDVVISLHACDTATDYALNYAITHNAKYIFSVPCCQHEINTSSLTKNGGDMGIMFEYGIIKERTCALLTDVFRGKLLEDFGYSVDIMEFVDLSHSPKNLMIRAARKHKPNFKNKSELQQLQCKYGFSQCLYKLLYE